MLFNITLLVPKMKSLILLIFAYAFNATAQSDSNKKEKAKAFFAISDYAKARKLNPDYLEHISFRELSLKS